MSTKNSYLDFIILGTADTIIILQILPIFEASSFSFPWVMIAQTDTQASSSIIGEDGLLSSGL
jgi:hypothetical protein